MSIAEQKFVLRTVRVVIQPESSGWDMMHYGNVSTANHNLNGHLYSMKLIDSPACSCGFINENEFHFFLVCPLYNRPRVTLQNAMGNIAPFTLRTLLYGSENLDLTVNKRIVTEILWIIKYSKRFDP